MLLNTIKVGLYRSVRALPGQEAAIPANALIYLGRRDDGSPFVVRPGQNRNNLWYWGEPVVALTNDLWAASLLELPREGFYTLPEDLVFGEGGRWPANAIVQLGYNTSGQAILFVAEHRRGGDGPNVLSFSDKGMIINDDLLFRLNWAPILPVEPNQQAAAGGLN